MWHNRFHQQCCVINNLTQLDNISGYEVNVDAGLSVLPPRHHSPCPGPSFSHQEPALQDQEPEQREQGKGELLPSTPAFPTRSVSTPMPIPASPVLLSTSDQTLGLFNRERRFPGTENNSFLKDNLDYMKYTGNLTEFVLAE